MDREVNQIISELKSTETFNSAIPKLHNFLARNPSMNLDFYIRDESANMKEMIKSNLESYKNQLCKCLPFINSFLLIICLFQLTPDPLPPQMLSLSILKIFPNRNL